MTVWYMYPLDSPGSGYGQGKDPLGNYLKPDTNVAVPSGLPITSLTAGVVTDRSDHGGCCGGLSVTILMDKPINNVATHVSYNFLGSAIVSKGQRVVAGQQIGTSGSIYGILTAVGLTPDDTWGGASFSSLQAKGDQRVNPLILLNAVRSGKPIPQSGPGPITGAGAAAYSFTTTKVSSGAAVAFQSVSYAAHDTLNNIPGFLGIVEALDEIEQFQPFVLPDGSGVIGKIPILGGILAPITIPADSMQALLTFITANAVASLVRGIIILFGIVILVALVKNAMSQTIEGATGQTPGQLASSALKIAAVA